MVDYYEEHTLLLPEFCLFFSKCKKGDSDDDLLEENAELQNLPLNNESTILNFSLEDRGENFENHFGTQKSDET